MIRRIAMTSQTIARRTIAPMIWAREKRISANLSQDKDPQKQPRRPGDNIYNAQNLGRHRDSAFVMRYIVNLNRFEGIVSSTKRQIAKYESKTEQAHDA